MTDQDAEIYRVECDNCGFDEERDTLSAAVEAVETHNAKQGCLYPLDTSIELPETEADNPDDYEGGNLHG